MPGSSDDFATSVQDRNTARPRRSVSALLAPIRAIGPTVGANLINQAVVALTQLAVIPLLISRWGVEGYGTWLLLTALPNYLTISDFGFTTSAKTDMAIRATGGDVRGAQVTASSVAALLVVALAIIAVGYFAMVAIVDWPAALKLPTIDRSQAELVLGLGFVQLAAYQASLLSSSVVRAAGRPALEVLLAALFRTLETAALVAAAYFGGGFVAGAFAWAATRLLTTVACWIMLYVALPTLVPKWQLVDWSRVRLLFKPSIAYMLVPLSNAIFIQGTVLALGLVTGPVVVAAYSTMRVVTRMGVSASNVLNFAFTPQYSYAIGAGAMANFWTLLKTHIGLMVLGTLAYVLVMLGAGPWLVRLLSHGQVEPPALVLALLTAAAVFEMFWGIGISLGSARNMVGRFSLILLGLSLLNLACTYAVAGTYQLLGASAVIACAQLATCVAILLWWQSAALLLTRAPRHG